MRRNERRPQTRTKRSNVRALVLLLPMLALAASACQSILGIESWSKKPDASGCILASDCTGSQVCLFQTCSEPCAKDKDCTAGSYCLRTDEGSACVSDEQAQCGTQDCPAGTVCNAGHCQATCDKPGSLCPGGQECAAGICISSGPDAGGTGGTSSGGGNNASAGETSAAGATGLAGAAGAAGDLGEGGAPPVVVDDGTAIGTAAAKCSKAGALACSGHAQRVQLVCQNGTWQTNGSCTDNALCDSTPGANAGSCQPVVPECQNRVQGHRFCRGTETDVRECGLDLVSATVVDSCMFVCSAGACAGECHSTEKKCKAGGLIPQACSDAGTWQEGTACTYKCDAPTGKCLAAGCGDTAKNGDETDIDCGGSCSGCKVGDDCKGDTDCVYPASARCINNQCAAASCTDGVKNGTETDTDCGGTCAKRCAVNQSCTLNSDCLLPDSGHCTALKCVPFSCIDGIKNGSETDKDCGGTCAADCGIGFGCGMDSDCSTAACLGTACVACKPLSKVCVNSSAQTCSAAGTWDTPVPCTVTNGTGNCAGQGVCGIQSCNSGFGNCDNSVQTGCEANLNDPTACGTTCGNRLTCSTAHATAACTNGTCKPNCAQGYGDCNAATANDGCERALNSVTSCGTSCASISTCTAPAQICTSGACVANTPYNVGQASATGSVQFDPPPDIWHVVPVAIARDATVLKFQLIGFAGSSGQARMGLWADDGTGKPGAYLSQSPAFSVAPGIDGAAPQVNTTVTGGKTYWIGAKFVGSAKGFQFSSSGAVAYTTPQAFAQFASALMPFPATAGKITNTAYNFYLQVQDTPP
ncbi:MAG TPA: hypothetical protein VJV79_18860 [Polyangiaceae bacterium]|nr:hypothetical protein [Polyangiaceae bacterium]